MIASAQPCRPRQTLKARYVFPVAGRPIRNGTVTITGKRIAAVGEASPVGEVEDLGNVAILPGLVNAHTHLEFSDLAQPLGTTGMSLVDWIRAVLRFRREGGDSSPRSGAVRQGLCESVRAGTTTLGEIAQPTWDAEPFEHCAADVTVFQELIAPTRERIPQAYEIALRFLLAAGPWQRWRAGLCPHAPYSVHPEFFRQLLSGPRMPAIPIAFHLAESKEELELLRFGRGPFREFLAGLDGWTEADFPAGKRPLDYLHLLAAADRALIVHGNYLDDEEIAFVARHKRTMAVVYCPRTHAYFHHDWYPLEKMLAAGLNVALGTDSRASSPDLSILAEMRFASDLHPAVPRGLVLQLGTIAAARALGRAAEVGTLEPGKYADLVAVALPNADCADPHELLFDSNLPVVATWFRGERSPPGPLA